MTQPAPAPSSAVERIEVEPVNKAGNRSLYKKREKIHPKTVTGFFRTLKWRVMAVTLAIYYLTPWIRWDRGPHAPDQAVLIDLDRGRFYFFFIELWSHEIYYLTGLLIMAALGLFLMTALAGRVWCGYTCPQTVWTDLFMAVERLIEGDRNARIKLDGAPMSLDKFVRRLAKHGAWLLIALATGGAWVFYFHDAPTLIVDLVSFDAKFSTTLAIFGLTFSTYVFGGLMREQVCTYMCPWPRIQGAMLDEDSMVVTYKSYRGEPRGQHQKGEAWGRTSHCVDCNACVAVCPMGIDIRDGQQLECITCALCIDACNNVMEKVGLPKYLIGYDTLNNVNRKARGEPGTLKLIRKRTIFYVVLWAGVGLLMLYALLTRPNLELNVVRDRNPLYVTLKDGSIRNGYSLRLLNKAQSDREFVISVEGLEKINLASAEGELAPIPVKADDVRTIKVFASVARDQVPAANNDITFTLKDPNNGESFEIVSQFMGPQK